MALRRDQKSLLVAGVLSVLFWTIQPLRLLILPLVYLNTHIHELCHALAAWATGGQVEYIKVFANGSGVTPVLGGSLIALASAGYVGSAAVGGAIVALSGSAKWARLCLMALCALLGFSVLLFVRGDSIGVFTGIGWCALLGFLAFKLPQNSVILTSQILGVQLGLTSVQSVLTLVKVAVATESHSDALLMQNATGVPDIVWAVLWMAVGFVCVGFGVWWAWRSPSKVHGAA